MVKPLITPKELSPILARLSEKSVRVLAISCFNLIKSDFLQLDLFGEIKNKENLSLAVDNINNRWGNFTITVARALKQEQQILDRIAFGQSGAELL